MSDEMEWEQKSPRESSEPRYTHYQINQNMGQPVRGPHQKPKKRKRRVREEVCGNRCPCGCIWPGCGSGISGSELCSKGIFWYGTAGTAKHDGNSA